MDKKSSPQSIVYPRAINHIAVSVTDLDKAVKWYQEVLGFTVINGPVEFEADDSVPGMVIKDIHGPNFKKMRTVWLSSGNQVGIEIFEYLDQRHKGELMITLNTGNQDLSISVLLILILMSCAEKFLKMEENSGVKYGISLQVRGLK